MAPIYVIDVLDSPGYSFPERFERFLGLEQLQVDWALVDGIRDSDSLASLLDQQPAGIVISGSVRGVYEDLPWLAAVEDLIRAAHARSVPLLGICFGHQLLARAMGGQAEKGPSWEFGVHPVYLYEGAEHPWLQGFESGCLTVQTHQDYVIALPPGATALGFSRQSAYQMFSLGSCLGIQFHPEYTREDLQLLSGQRVQRFLDARAFQTEAHVRAYAAALPPADLSRIVLRNFLLAPERVCV
ncbi:MAG: hypothetical protein CVV27_15275 [Candidatus Melainabacteria bacterium HGW-Melainabacteria-1]|nr:MAG: hypothetical protein CVV27_15275 [Candidatus Melainabacteria bacterium HGW-Melainabacteria-1]